MRILLANTGHPATIKGGAEAAVLDLARRLVRQGHSVALVTHHAGRELERGEEDGIRLYGLPNRNVYFGFDGAHHAAPVRLAWHAIDSANPWMGQAFGRILDEERPEVVNTHAVVGLSQIVWRETKKRRLPLVHYLHEYGTMCPRGSAFAGGHLCATPCRSCKFITVPRKRLSSLVDTVVGVSRFTLQRHLDWGFFPEARQAVIPNIFQDVGFRGRHVRPGSPLRIGYFGRLIEDKGAHLLVEAVKRLAPHGWTLDIAGTGEAAYTAELKAAAPAGVRFHGWAQAEAFFPEIDLLVVPSLWPDPQPRVTFEAFMHGVPVLGARAGGIPEEIDEGKTGWLFEAGSAQSLAEALAARLVDRADRGLPAQNFRQRLARLDPDRVIGEYEAVYADAIAASRTPKVPLTEIGQASRHENAMV